MCRSLLPAVFLSVCSYFSLFLNSLSWVSKPQKKDQYVSNSSSESRRVKEAEATIGNVFSLQEILPSTKKKDWCCTSVHLFSSSFFIPLYFLLIFKCNIGRKKNPLVITNISHHTESCEWNNPWWCYYYYSLDYYLFWQLFTYNFFTWTHKST